MKYFKLATIILIVLLKNYFVTASIPVCITNCVQCKQMYGPYFQGKACGEGCLQSNGLMTPDCNNPRTLGSYLKRLI